MHNESVSSHLTFFYIKLKFLNYLHLSGYPEVCSQRGHEHHFEDYNSGICREGQEHIIVHQVSHFTKFPTKDIEYYRTTTKQGKNNRQRNLNTCKCWGRKRFSFIHCSLIVSTMKSWRIVLTTELFFWTGSYNNSPIRFVLQHSLLRPIHSSFV